MGVFQPASSADRQAATEFVGRVTRWELTAVVRILAAADGGVEFWARSAFGVMASRRVAGHIQPDPITVYATDLLGGLAISAAAAVDPGPDATDQWLARLPPASGWSVVGSIPAQRVREIVSDGTAQAQVLVDAEREFELRAATKATVPPRILDAAAWTAGAAGHGLPVTLRMILAVSAMGLLEADPGEPVVVNASRTWVSLETSQGLVARRRMADV